MDGIEYNDKIFNSILALQFKNKVKLIKDNFMLFNSTNNYDLIIGNPPYFVCKKTDIPSKYNKFCVGRPNIFGGFIIHSLSMLNNNGILAFIIPKSFLNSSYYSLIRNHIKETCKIIDIIDFKQHNDFIDTSQCTFGIILQKLNQNNIQPDECKFSVKINNNFIFSTDSYNLKEILTGSTTLSNMKLKVRTGNIVWNQHKDELTYNENDTMLIYNTNISNDNKVEIKVFKNEEKKQYINKYGRINPTLVVNRGNGNSIYKLNYALLEKGPYLIENHLNEIYTNEKIDNNELLEIYNKVINSFKNPKTQQFIELFLGNNGLSKTELETIFPIYI
jgi:adenine-specific DNA-methyltransferase